MIQRKPKVVTRGALVRHRYVCMWFGPNVVRAERTITTPVENTPTETQIFSLYGLLAFNVQYWNGSSWVTIPGETVTGNNKVWRKFTFSPITTSKIRVYINTVPEAWSRVVEIQAFGTSSGGDKVRWLMPDHLGTPRIILDEVGNLANVRRHDYLPFGAGTSSANAQHELLHAN
jgi:hypothetical protein